jgi:hypothetical protein
LITSLRPNGEWTLDIGLGTDLKTECKKSVSSLIYTLAERVSEIRTINILDNRKIDKYLLSASSHGAADVSFRKFLESGDADIFDEVGNEFKIMFPMSFVTNLMAKSVSPLTNNKKNKKLVAVNILLGDLLVDNIAAIATIWERLVLASIVCTSYEPFASVHECFGIRERGSFPVFAATFDSVLKGTQYESSRTMPGLVNTLLVAPDYKEGWDGKAQFPAFNLSVYTQMKIAPSQKPLVDVIAKTIIYSLSDAYMSRNSFPNTHIVLYNFADTMDAANISIAVQAIIRAIHDGIGVKGSDFNARCETACSLAKIDSETDSFKAFVKAFLGVNYDSLKTLHYLRKVDMDRWMVPSFLPFACVCQAIGGDESDTKSKTE